MKKIAYVTSAVALLVAGSAYADKDAKSDVKKVELTAPKIAIVNFRGVLDKSKAAQDVRAEIEKKRTETQKEMMKYEAELREKDQAIAKEAAKLSESEVTKKKADLQARAEEIQKKVQIRKVQLEQAFSKASAEVEQKILKITDEVRKDVGANLVLPAEQVVVADPTMEITDVVSEKLNKQMPSVKVSYESERDILKKMEANKQ